MRRIFSISCFVLIAINSAVFAIRPLKMSDFYKIKQAENPKISHDDEWVVYEVSRYDSVLNKTVSDIWLASLKSNITRKLTENGTKNSQPVWAPNRHVIAYISNRSGSNQIWIMDIETRATRQLTFLENGAWDPQWAPDGKSIAFLSETQFKGRNPEGLYDIKLYTHLRYRWWYDDNRYDEGWRSHIFITGVDSGNVRQLTDGDHFDKEFSFSPDGKKIAFVSNRTEDRENNIDTDIWIVTTDSGKVTKAFENTGPDYTPVWSENGRYLAWRSTFRYNYESDNYDIMVKDFKDEEITNLTEDFDRVVRDIQWNPNNKDLFLIAGDEGNYNLYEASVKNREVKPVIERNHRIRGWDVDSEGENVVMARTIPTRPEEIYYASLDKKTMKRISVVNDNLLKEVDLQEAISVWFTGDKETPVQGWYITPPDFDKSKKYPMILSIHGGPQGMFKNQFDFEYQATAAQGYVVFYCNHRGSFGYGQQFTDDVNQDYGGSCYRDIMNGVDYMISLGFIDENRMGVTGLSFGGWMTSWIIGHTDRFKAAVPMAPFVNMLSFYGTTDEQFFPEWDFGGHPYDPDTRIVYEKNSPINYAQNFNTPTLIIHGENDWRCHITEGEQLFTALKKMGVPAVLARVPREAHVFTEPHHIEASIRMKLDWWERYVR